ncbi:hypothetical protein J6590_020447 [Homalodisca vitripennis]|nr:hypothetical protein J6590_020447 [Homalodisca vitripennis]
MKTDKQNTRQTVKNAKAQGHRYDSSFSIYLVDRQTSRIPDRQSRMQKLKDIDMTVRFRYISRIDRQAEYQTDSQECKSSRT